MHQPNPHTRNFNQVRLAHPLVSLKPIAMPIQPLISIPQRRDHRRNRRQLIQHAIHVNIPRMHHKIDPGKNLENPRRQMLARLRNMSVRDKPDSH